MRDMGPTVRGALGYNGEHGAAVLGVSPDSPAQMAGLQPWDVILKFNGETIRSSAQLFTMVQATRVGETAKLEVWRKGEKLELNAVITESGGAVLTPQQGRQKPQQGRTRDPDEVLQALGIEVRELSLHEQMRGLWGVIVTAVAPRGLAADKLAPSDRIIGVNHSRINSPSEFFLHLSASAAVQDTALHLIREGKPLRVTVPALPRSE
jgi:serine protease Do